MARKPTGKSSSTRGANTRGPSVRKSSEPRSERGDRISPRGQRNTVYVRSSGRKSRKARKENALRRRSISIIGSLGFTVILIGGAATLYAMQGLPDIRSLNTVKKERGVTFESEDGKVLATYGDVTGRYIPYEQLPKPLIQAVLATEDRRFFSHMGVDVWGIIRAATMNAAAGRVVQGGSTVTQQLAKNVFLTPERSVMRKLQEVLLALALEARYSKQEILTIYLNRMYLGSGVYGLDAAAKRYFNKRGNELNLAESAMLAGLLKAPSRYAPTSSKERAIARAEQVLVNMREAGMLTAEETQRARKSLHTTQIVQAVEGGDARYFTDWVMEELPNYVGRIEDDLIVTTTVQTDIQAAAEDAVQNVVATKGSAMNASQGALVAMSPDGAVRALVGGINYFKGPYNRAVQAQRQPGSSFKLFVYLAALEAGLTPNSLVEDGPISMTVGNRTWSPENYGHSYKGEVTMTQGLRESLNTVAVRLAQYAGVSRVAQMAMRLGIRNVPSQPSIALGSKETSLLDMTAAYAHMPSHGYEVKPYGIIAIRTPKGTKLYDHDEEMQSPRAQVLASDVVEMANYMLMDVVRRGTGTRAGLPGRDVAGKTGTSQNYKDAWFMGYTAQLAAGVWVGNDNNAPMKNATGGSISAQIWHDFMIKAMEGMPAENLPARDSSGGFLPWLFGGDTTRVNDDTLSAVDQTLPQDVPFEIKQGGEPVSDEATNNGGAHEEPVIDAGPRTVDEAMPKGFLDTLVDSLPQGEVKYEYPSNDNRRR